jgi:hypothetical protein
VYPRNIVEEFIEAVKEGSIKPPKTIFLPCEAILQIFIEATIKWSKEDTI